MDTTASSFTLRKNAKRAAEAMIRNGTAPAVDYDINPSGNGRFEIVWKTVKAAPTADEVETEIAEASADQPEAVSPTEATSQPAPAVTEPATTDAPTQPLHALLLLPPRRNLGPDDDAGGLVLPVPDHLLPQRPQL